LSINEAQNVTAGVSSSSQYFNEDSTSSNVSHDPVLEHLLRDVKSKYVRERLLSEPPEVYTEQKDVRIMVGLTRVQGTHAFWLSSRK